MANEQGDEPVTDEEKIAAGIAQLAFDQRVSRWANMMPHQLMEERARLASSSDERLKREILQARIDRDQDQEQPGAGAAAEAAMTATNAPVPSAMDLAGGDPALAVKVERARLMGATDDQIRTEIAKLHRQTAATSQ